MVGSASWPLWKCPLVSHPSIPVCRCSPNRFIYVFIPLILLQFLCPRSLFAAPLRSLSTARATPTVSELSLHAQELLEAIRSCSSPEHVRQLAQLQQQQVAEQEQQEQLQQAAQLQQQGLGLTAGATAVQELQVGWGWARVKSAAFTLSDSNIRLVSMLQGSMVKAEPASMCKYVLAGAQILLWSGTRSCSSARAAAPHIKDLSRSAIVLVWLKLSYGCAEWLLWQVCQ